MSNTATCGIPGAEHRARGGDAAQIVRIVQRRELDELLDPAPDVVVDPRRLGEPLTAVHDTVPHGLDVGDAADRHAGFAGSSASAMTYSTAAA